MVNISIKLQIQFYYISTSFHISCLLNTPTCQEPLKKNLISKLLAHHNTTRMLTLWCTGVEQVSAWPMDIPEVT